MPRSPRTHRANHRRPGRRRLVRRLLRAGESGRLRRPTDSLRDVVRSFAKRTMRLRHVNPLPRPAKRVPPCRRRGSYCAADNRGLREASPEARHRSPTASCCRCFAADQRAAYPPCDWFGGTKTGQKPPTDFRGLRLDRSRRGLPQMCRTTRALPGGRGGVTTSRLSYRTYSAKRDLCGRLRTSEVAV